MENNIGSEYKNIIETWDENEKKRAEGNAAANPKNNPEDEVPARNDLEQLIKQEAAEYDNENKENRILSGDRATVNDDANASDE